MYDHSSLLIVATLFVTLAIAIEAGYRLGCVFGKSATEPAKVQINTIQASLLGILALLLGFTFSLALQRYDSRSEAVINEANAIGTAILRSDLLPAPWRTEIQEALRAYLDLRIRAGVIPLDRRSDRNAVLAESNIVLETLWQKTRLAVEQNGGRVTTGLFVQAFNEMVDSYGTRDAALNRHVPEPVLFLLFGTFVLTAGLVGYSSGVASHRASMATYALVVLIVMLVFVIIDLDRPRRGLIEVSQQSLLDLQATLGSPPAQ